MMVFILIVFDIKRWDVGKVSYATFVFGRWPGVRPQLFRPRPASPRAGQMSISKQCHQWDSHHSICLAFLESPIL